MSTVFLLAPKFLPRITTSVPAPPFPWLNDSSTGASSLKAISGACAVCCGRTVTPLTTVVANVGRMAATSYVPTGTCFSVKVPFSAVIATYWVPGMKTVVPSRFTPPPAVTWPVIVPVGCRTSGSRFSLAPTPTETFIRMALESSVASASTVFTPKGASTRRKRPEASVRVTTETPEPVDETW
ncbi:hypothetical protein D3C86_1640740 [compost metagenome]